ncbi:MAG: cell division protein ZapA [Nitrospinota bacterium]|nr:cell division protein ZapA [Nitrospinota bacterium]
MDPIKINIFNATYSIKTDYDPKYVARLASFVDKKMREVHEKSNTPSTQKVAVLTSMSIADEMFKIKEGGMPLSFDMEDKIEELIRRIDSAIETD